MSSNSSRLPARIDRRVPFELVRERRPRKTFPKVVTDAPFHVVLRLLRRIVDRTGTAAVGPRRLEDGFPLGLWVQYHRAEWRAGRLSYSRVQALEGLRGWSWHPYGDQFRVGLAKLHRFARREGHVRVPLAHVEDGFRLGIWAQAMRTRYRQGELSAEKSRLLEELPGWRERLREGRHGSRLAALRAFVKKHGHACVPQKTVVDGVTLGDWVRRRRQDWRKGRLAPVLVKELAALPGWKWRVGAARRTK